MKKTRKHFLSAFAAVALAAVMAFGGIGTSVAQAASVDARKMEAYVDVEEAKALIAEAEAEMRKFILNKEKDLKTSKVSLGTTPRRITDLVGSLSDLVSGSGDKGTPIVLITGYFDNYATE